MSLSGFAMVVRRHRLAAGFTQEQLAERASLSLRTVGDIERGHTRRPYRRSAELLGAAFGLSDSDLDRFIRYADPLPPGSPGPGSRVQAAGAAAHDQPITVPRQLPLNPPRIVGRSHVLTKLSGLLDGAAATRMVVVAISGISGSGKTALALRYAYREAHRFPDGQLYVDLHGSSSGRRPVPSGTALSGILQSLQVPANGKFVSTDAQAAWYRSVLAGRQMMIILDDARDAMQVRPLLPSAPHCAVVITSRRRLTSLAAREGAHLVNLDVLSDSEAQQLLTGLIGPLRAAREPDAAMMLARCCSGLPLALSIVGARARISSHLTLTALAHRLTDPERAWGILDGGGDPACNVRAAFSSAVDMLSTDARRMLRALAAGPGRHIDAGAAADLAGHDATHPAELLDELVLASLLSEDPSGGFTMNGLLQFYLRTLMPGNSKVSEQRPGAARRCHHDRCHCRTRMPCA